MILNLNGVERLTESDFNLFSKLVSTYYGIHHSCTAPVVMPSRLYHGKPISTFSYIYFDCAESKNEELKALSMMERRIELGSEDIEKHLNLMDNFVEGFGKIKTSAFSGNRTEVADKTDNLIENLTEYVSLIDNHSKKLGENSFLYYPVSIPGHFVHFVGSPYIGNVSFNLSQNCMGANEEINELTSLVSKFRDNKDRIKTYIHEFEFANDDRLDSSLRGVLATTKQLLSKVGFDYKG